MCETAVSRHTRFMSLLLGSVVLAAGLVCAVRADAQAIVSGAENDVTIEAHDTSLQDVLAALGARFGLRYRNVSALDRRINGTYGGSLRGVVARLLDGYDYVMKTDGGRIEVIVLGAANSRAMPAATRRRSD